MEAALYDPDDGFYGAGRVRFGARGDFATASTTHPVLGEIVAAWAREAWVACGSPPEFALVEAGPGDGRLAAAIADALASARGGPAWSLLLVERSATLAARQRDVLAGAPMPVSWTSLDALAAAPRDAAVVSIELVDAMPVHRARVRARRVEEQFVVATETGAVAEWAAPSTPDLAAYLARFAPWVLEADASPEVEISLDALAWVRSTARAVRRGAVLTIDYGDTARRLYTADRPRGTIRAFRGGQLFEDVLAEPGARDITASVNFTALADGGRDAGLEAISFERQSDFLARFGLVERVARRATGATVADRVAMKSLIIPGGASDGFHALVQRRCA